MATHLIRVYILLFFVTASAGMLSAQIDPDLFAGMKARSIGPATMSGRIAAIDAVEANPDVIYVGAATGGVWKSENSGLTWKPVFDDQKVAAIGAVAVFQPSPDIVWVGTGEANPRNSMSVGNGVYRSLDGGLTWTHLGLDETERISRILLHPIDPEVAYVAAMGKAWGENPERGVFKTTDGGKTWKRVLHVDEKTGAADLVMDPQNPQKLIAAMWDYRRWPWFFRSGGPGSGIFITYDGGETWKRRTHVDGLPEGDLGRIGLAIAPSDPRVIYAYVEAEKIGLYKSLDGGESWNLAGADRLVGNRPFYYADLRVDPKNPDRVYSLWSIVSLSRDGGKSFERLISYGDVHPDHHALWINPENPDHMINGNDGGIYISRDQGKTWWFARNLPLGQYYHIRVDMDVPYNVYGGMQDNGSWRGPSTVWEDGGIRNFHWRELCYGDGFDTVPDPEDSMRGYAMSQEGYLSRWNLHTGELKDVRPAPVEKDVELRFNWNAGIAVDPFVPSTIYYGSQYVHKSVDRGDTWTAISGDLTTDNPEWQKQDESGGLTLDVTGAENFTSIVAIAPSPLQEGLLWVGTDDGRLHVTRDGGGAWTSVEKNLPNVPENTWIPHIAPSHFDPAEAFIVCDNHRRSDWEPYIFRTTDYGATWTDLAVIETDDEDYIWGYALAIEQDPVEADLLYLGTEFGLYLSLDAGKKWFKWTHGVPTVSVMDLVVHPREHDLVVGTHGRSAFVLDDVRPLREISADTASKKLHLFEAPPARQYRRARAASTRDAGTNEFRGENRTYGALLTFWMDFEDLPHPDEDKERARLEELKQKKAAEGAAGESTEKIAKAEEGDREEAEEAAHKEAEEESPREGRDGEKKKGPQVEIEVANEEGKVIRTFKEEVHQGINRVAWDLRMDAFKEVKRPGRESWDDRGGVEVMPGAYTVKLKYKDHEAEGKVLVLADPRSDLPEGARQANFDAIMRTGLLQETTTRAIERIQQVKADLKTVTALLKAKDSEDDEKDSVDDEKEDPSAKEGKKEHKALMKAARALKKKLIEVEKLFWSPERTQEIGPSKHVSRKVRYPMRSLGSSWDGPTAAQLAYLAEAEAALEKALAELNHFLDEEVSSFKEKVEEAGVQLFKPEEPIEME